MKSNIWSLLTIFFCFSSIPCFGCVSCVEGMIELYEKCTDILVDLENSKEDKVYLSGYLHGIQAGFNTSIFYINKKHPGYKFHDAEKMHFLDEF